MAQSLGCTCLQGLDLALKWASRRCDPDLVRCTASVAQDCLHRQDCRMRDECDTRLHELEEWLALADEAGLQEQAPRPTSLRD